MIKKDGLVIWPAYFDIKNSRDGGRRVPKELAVHHPSADDLLQACKNLGWSAEKVSGAHPRRWYLKTGYVVVKPNQKLSKSVVVRKLAEELRKIGKK